MKLTSYGAALEVTGSQHLLEVNGKKILLDCGLFQGRRKEAWEKNHEFGFNPEEVDAVILSHAHIDHCGNLPTLVKRGFKGVIYCTEATERLLGVMLLDSAHIQQNDAEYFAKRLPDTALKPIEPLYNDADVEFTMKLIKGMQYDTSFILFDGINVTLRQAGHVLGSAVIVIDIKDKKDGKKKRFSFTGDLGRCNLPIIQDPYALDKTDYLLIESTYGNRTHSPIDEGIPALARIINRTAKRGGKIIIPAFALERTQELIYGLHKAMKEHQIPDNIPIFMDSPLATTITSIFKQFTDLYDPDVRKQFRGAQNPFLMRQLKTINTVEESKKLNQFIGPCIIISASGMCEAGRIRHHLRNNIEDPKNTIVIVGYQAEHTLGRKLVENAPVVKIFDMMYDVKAEVVVLESFSAHADMNDLDAYIKNVKGLKHVFLVHGEVDQSGPLADRITAMKKRTKATVSEPKKTYEF